MHYGHGQCDIVLPLTAMLSYCSAQEAAKQLRPGLIIAQVANQSLKVIQTQISKVTI